MCFLIRTVGYVVGTFLCQVSSFRDIRHTFQLDDVNTLRNYLVGMGFLLLNIFLGLLGTFWFRTQQRKGEMALMMAVGGSKQSVFFRLLSEGWLMLLLVTPLAIGVDFYIAKSELTLVRKRLPTRYWEGASFINCSAKAADSFLFVRKQISLPEANRFSGNKMTADRL